MEWSEIVRYGQRSLSARDKDPLCEALCWLELDSERAGGGADQLTQPHLATLFRLAQDMLKYKTEQVNNLLGELESAQQTKSKKKLRAPNEESPSGRPAHAHAASADGEEEAADSESSRGALSEMNAAEQLRLEVSMRNRHIRKLLDDLQILEEENVQLKEKISALNEKLSEATRIIEDLTEQLLALNTECTKLKGVLGNVEEAKSQLTMDMKTLQKKLYEKDINRDILYEEIRSKVQHWKNIAQSQNKQIEALIDENRLLKESLNQQAAPVPTLEINNIHSKQTQELQKKLAEASTEIIESAKLIESLKSENKQLKATLKETPGHGSVCDLRNESDDGKERALINKLKRTVNDLTVTLNGAEEMVTAREQELTEVTSQLQLIQSGEEGLAALIESLKSKKRQLKLKDEGIKSLVKELNELHQTADNLMLENEAMRLKLKISPNVKISTKGIIKKYENIENKYMQMTKELKKIENKLISLEIENRDKSEKITKLIKFLHYNGYGVDQIEKIYGNDKIENAEIPTDGGGESSVAILQIKAKEKEGEINKKEKEMMAIVEENEGLRKGLQEILEVLKDNSTSTSGILTLQCPSLESVLQSLEARHSAGWFAPHMATVLELRAALGGRDALLTALHQAKKETFDVLSQLTKESRKSQELEQKLHELKCTNESEIQDVDEHDFSFQNMKFGSWMSCHGPFNVDISNRRDIENIQNEGTFNYENQLRNCLGYFHNKFKELFHKMTAISIKLGDEQNKWYIQEEKYKVEIENLKSNLSQIEDENISETSPGLISIPSVTVLLRKCAYLEESYKYIRTLNENIKNELLESKKETMILTAEHEIKIQRLILSFVNVTDKLRNSISLDLFWKQLETLNELTSKYNKVVHGEYKRVTASDVLNHLKQDKINTLNTFQKTFYQKPKTEETEYKEILTNVEHTVLQNQIERLCIELENVNKRLEDTENKYFELQQTQGKIIDKNSSTATEDEINGLRDQLNKVMEENNVLKERCQHVGSQLEIALSQLQDTEERRLSKDIEIDMLRHEILDLQSSSDNKAVIGRLSNEILVARLQVMESHKKLEKLNSALSKEIQRRDEAEEMFKARENIFNIYSQRYESKFRFMYEVTQILRQQYQGCLPLASVENYINNIEDLNRKLHAANEQLNEIEDLRTNLMIKHTVFNQVLDVAKGKCLRDEDRNKCAHEIQLIVLQNTMTREKEHYITKIQTLEQSRAEISKQCNSIERSLILVNQVFHKPDADVMQEADVNPYGPSLELEDVQSDEDSRRSRTITLPKPQVLMTPKNDFDISRPEIQDETNTLPGSPIITQHERVNVFVQTTPLDIIKNSKVIQTEMDKEVKDLIKRVNDLQKNLAQKNEELSELSSVTRKKTEEILTLTKEKANLEINTQNLKETIHNKEILMEKLKHNLTNTKLDIEESKKELINQINTIEGAANEETKSLLETIRNLENDKNIIVNEYKQLLTREREEYLKSVRDLNEKIVELKTQLDRKVSDASSTDAVKQISSKYSVKTIELEDKCFKLQSDLDSFRSEITRYKSEAERWKDLATERLSKMEQLNSQLEEQHCHEMDTYKLESQHWLTQLNESQRERSELRDKLADQRALHSKQLAERDAHIHQLRALVQHLKSEIMSMQAAMSATEPTFDLSAIVETEDSEVGSCRGSERLEIRFDSSTEVLRDDAPPPVPSNSTALWQEPVIERLRREKQLVSKQNCSLRRQVKALAARERRARLEAHNLKHQVYRISTSGSKGATAESTSLQAKIASLQAQLTSARRDTHSSVALWDKWKRAQQASERWQAKYEETSREVAKLESSLTLAKSAVTRLEREKRALLARLNDAKSDEKPTWHEKRDSPPRSDRSGGPPPHVSAESLMDRIRAQQRRIAALELAEKGNEPLVSEYERLLAEVTMLRGQVLTLESSLLETQLHVPRHAAPDTQPELNYWKNYCDMLKEENMQLSLKLSSLETAPPSAHHRRVNDLEQTVLTLRGLVSKLQAEQKNAGSLKRIDSRLGCERSVSTDKAAAAVEAGGRGADSLRTEITNLKRSMAHKDDLLERSKEMLKVAAEREEDLLRENAYLHRQIEELTRHRGGFLSA